MPAQVRRRGLLFFHHFMGRHAVLKHPLAGWAALLAERRVLHAYPHILTGAPSVQERIRSRVGPTLPVDCVYNGVDDGYFGSAATEEPYLLYLGRIDVAHQGDRHPAGGLRAHRPGAPRPGAEDRRGR